MSIVVTTPFLCGTSVLRPLLSMFEDSSLPCGALIPSESRSRISIKRPVHPSMDDVLVEFVTESSQSGSGSRLVVRVTIGFCYDCSTRFDGVLKRLGTNVSL